MTRDPKRQFVGALWCAESRCAGVKVGVARAFRSPMPFHCEKAALDMTAGPKGVYPEPCLDICLLCDEIAVGLRHF
jgi:hypothetical protein